METLLILGVVGLAYLLISRPGGLLASSGGSASLAAQLNSNQHEVNLNTAGILGAEYQPNTGLQLTQVATQQGLQVGQGFASSAAEGGSAAGAAVSTAIPIVGAVLAVGFGFLAAHTQRVKDAKAENEGINNFIPAFDADLKEINAAYRSGQISETMAVSYLSQVRDQYWQYMNQFQGKPGVAMRPCLPVTPGPVGASGSCGSAQLRCDKGCTAGCCIGCGPINGSVANQIWALQTGYRGPVGVCHVFGSKYGASDRAGYTLSW